MAGRWSIHSPDRIRWPVVEASRSLTLACLDLNQSTIDGTYQLEQRRLPVSHAGMADRKSIMTHVLSTGGGKALLNVDDTALLLLDHQTGLFQTVKDISVAELRANTTALAKIAALLKIPVTTSASEPNGPNGPLMPEIDKFAPHAVYVPRKGEVNAWDNELFVKTVRETGKKTLVIAGVWTSVCVMFPALDAKAAGFDVYAVIDASGDPSELVSRTTLARFVQAGIVPTTANALICEFHRTWNRPEAAEIADIYTIVAPNYRAVMESYQRAKEAGSAR